MLTRNITFLHPLKLLTFWRKALQFYASVSNQPVLPYQKQHYNDLSQLLSRQTYRVIRWAAEYKKKTRCQSQLVSTLPV
jgi:hypothetical protein